MNRIVLFFALSLALVSVASAQQADPEGLRDIHRLGGSTAFYKPSLTTVASLKRMGDDPQVTANIRTVLGQAGLPDLTDNVVAALVGANASFMGGRCSDATPMDGTIVECDVQPGQALRWMAHRPQGGPALGLLRDIRWAGQKPFRAYLFRVTEDNRTYTFVVPKVCGNLSLMGVQEIPRVAAVTPAPVVVAVAAIEPPPPPPPPAPPLPPPPFLPPQAPPPAPGIKTVSFFVDALAGKDRRVRPIEGVDGITGLEFAQCSPLLGVKIGVAKRFQSDWELAAAVGVAFSLVTADDKVNEHEVFADVEVNKYLGGAFVGTGLSLWDLTRSDTFTPAWMVHVGLPLASNVHFLTEGRVFLDNADDIRNNYQFWGGVRVRF